MGESRLRGSIDTPSKKFVGFLAQRSTLGKAIHVGCADGADKGATWRAFNKAHQKSDHEEAEEINGRRNYQSWSRSQFISSGSLQRRINA